MQGQDIAHYAYHVKGAVPRASSHATDRTLNKQPDSAYLNYIQADSLHFPHSYFMSYMFYMNSRYTIQDTGTPLSNQFLLQGFGVMFDTVIDANYKDTGYALGSVVTNVIVDSLHITIGHNNHSGTQDTIIVQIDSVDFSGYPTSTVLHADTIYTSTGLSPSNDWLNPINLTVNAKQFQLKGNRFAVYVTYYGSKLDTMGFLPGFGDTLCHLGGSGNIPRGTHIGNYFNNLRANSYSSGYKYFFNDTSKTIPDSNGYMYGVTINCSNPELQYGYFQDNPISAYIAFTNITGINELSSPSGFKVAQNQPNPFNNTSSIAYDIKASAHITFSVYDLAGRQLLYNDYGNVAPGRHSISLEAGQFSPGIYLYTFNVNGSQITRKMAISR